MNSTYAYPMHYSTAPVYGQQDQQFWQQQADPSPLFHHPFDGQQTQLQVEIIQPELDALMNQHIYALSPPTASCDLHTHHLAPAPIAFASPVSPLSALHTPPTAFPPMPLDAPPATYLAPSPTLSHASTTSSLTASPPPPQFAVLTPTGHTIAASENYRDVLTAARVVRKAEASGLVDDSRVCAFCGKVCDRPSTLKTHLNSHTGARPHTCTVEGCGRQFTVLSNMYRHAKVCAAQRQREARRARAAGPHRH